MHAHSLAVSLACLVAVAACAPDASVEAFDMPDWMDIDFSEQVPDFGGGLEGTALSPGQCLRLGAATEPLPFASTPAEVEELAATFEELGLDMAELEPATGAVAAALRTAADGGADRTAMLGIWFDRSATAALRELSMQAMSQCGTGFRSVAFGPPDRIIELSAHDHPDSALIDDVASWSMSITGEPRTIDWSFGYLGREPVALCEQLSRSLESAGFAGTHVAVHDAALEDLAEGVVSGSCGGA